MSISSTAPARPLRGVSIGATKGAVTCLLGRNGVGKTSLLRAIFGLQPIRSGRIVWNGADLTILGAASARPPWPRPGAAGREIFPRLTVLENLQTGFSALKRGERVVPDEIYTLFPVLKSMLARRGGRSLGWPAAAARHRRAAGDEAEPLILDEPTEGIQPSIIKDIAAVIRGLAARGDMAILLVEQYFDFARELADSFAVMERGEIVLAGGKDDMIESKLKAHLTV